MLAELLRNHVDVANLYHECQARHDALSKWADSLNHGQTDHP